MIVTDEDALICDLAETYGIYDYKSLPARRVGIFAMGLRDDSRIKMKLSGSKVPLNTLLLGAIADASNLSVWQVTKDGAKGRNRPSSILQKLLVNEEPKLEGFDTPEQFEEWYQSMVR